MANSEEQSRPMPLALGTSLTIGHAATLHRLLLDEFEARSSVVIDLPEDAQVDLSFIQLIESARLSAALQDKQFTTSAPASGRLRSILERAGFTTDMSAESRAFWFHERPSA
jgi:hypothetical protein